MSRAEDARLAVIVLSVALFLLAIVAMGYGDKALAGLCITGSAANYLIWAGTGGLRR